jgi:hypothetical protein
MKTLKMEKSYRNVPAICPPEEKNSSRVLKPARKTTV